MDKKEAIQFLLEKLGETHHLSTLPYNNIEHPLWRNSVEDVLEEIFGRDSTEYRRFYETRAQVGPKYPQRDYLRLLKNRAITIQSIINKYETLGFESNTKVDKLTAFIAHEGETDSLRRLKDFLDALCIKYIIAEAEATDGRSIEKQVDWAQAQADFAICLATKGKAINKKTGKHYMGLNVADELGRSTEIILYC